MLNLVYLCTQRKKQETLNVAKESDEKDCGIYSNADAYFARGVAWLCLKSLQAKYIIYIQNKAQLSSSTGGFDLLWPI